MRAKRYIYMNHRIRDVKPSGPVIRAQVGKSRRAKESNCVEIRVWGRVIARVVYDPKSNPSPTHSVKAWVEVDGNPSVDVVPV